MGFVYFGVGEQRNRRTGLIHDEQDNVEGGANLELTKMVNKCKRW